jgi:putative ABC transport system ATP-binding protein
MSIPAIQAKNICKNYESEGVKTVALCGANFNIDKGEFVAIMGPSGSGKSTLMHILGLLDRLTDGEYFLDGQNVTKLSDDELASYRNEKIGFVFQAFNLLPRTTVLDNVKLPLIYSKDKANAEERAKKVLESVGLGHRLNYFTNQISGGEKQRVAIARALVNNPSVIFADEPTGNLDSKSGTQVMEILQNLNDAGNTIILVTHETYTAEHAKRIIKIKDGALISDEPVLNRRRANEAELLK